MRGGTSNRRIRRGREDGTGNDGSCGGPWRADEDRAIGNCWAISRRDNVRVTQR